MMRGTCLAVYSKPYRKSSINLGPCRLIIFGCGNEGGWTCYLDLTYDKHQCCQRKPAGIPHICGWFRHNSPLPIMWFCKISLRTPCCTYCASMRLTSSSLQDLLCHGCRNLPSSFITFCGQSLVEPLSCTWTGTISTTRSWVGSILQTTYRHGDVWRTTQNMGDTSWHCKFYFVQHCLFYIVNSDSSVPTTRHWPAISVSLMAPNLIDDFSVRFWTKPARQFLTFDGNVLQ